MSNKVFGIFTGIILVIHLLLATIFANNQIVQPEQWHFLADCYQYYLQGTPSYTGANFPGIGPTIGALPSIIASLTLFLFKSPLAIMLGIIVLRIAAFIIIVLSLKPYFTNKTLSYLIVLLAFSPWLLYETRLTEQALLLFGVALIFAPLMMLRKFSLVEDEYQNTMEVLKGNKIRDFAYTLLLLLGIYFSSQISYLSLAFIILTLILWVRNLIKLSLYGIFAFIIICAYPTYTTITAINSNPELTGVFFNNSSSGNFWQAHIYPVLKTFIDWFRLGSAFFPSYIIKGFNPQNLTTYPIEQIIYYVWLIVLYAVGTITLLFNLLVSGYTFKNNLKNMFSFKHINQKEHFLMLCSSYALLSIMIVVAFTPIKISSLALGVMFPFAILPILGLIAAHKALSNHTHIIILTTIAMFLIVVSLATASSSVYFGNAQTFIEQFANEM